MVGIDEVQFLDEGIVDVALRLVRRGARVLAAGLDRDFRGEPFGPMPQLLAHADDADKLHAICQICAGPATMTQRLVDGSPARRDDPVILVGASERYEARCRGCHRLADAAAAARRRRLTATAAEGGTSPLAARARRSACWPATGDHQVSRELAVGSHLPSQTRDTHRRAGASRARLAQVPAAQRRPAVHSPGPTVPERTSAKPARSSRGATSAVGNQIGVPGPIG